jgi:hypothetical protein
MQAIQYYQYLIRQGYRATTAHVCTLAYACHTRDEYHRRLRRYSRYINKER